MLVLNENYHTTESKDAVEFSHSFIGIGEMYQRFHGVGSVKTVVLESETLVSALLNACLDPVTVEILLSSINVDLQQVNSLDRKAFLSHEDRYVTVTSTAI